MMTNFMVKNSRQSYTEKYLIIVKRCPCQLGMRYDIQLFCPGESVEDIDQEVIHGIFSKIYSENEESRLTIAVFCFCDASAQKVLSPKLAGILGDDAVRKVFQIFYVRELKGHVQHFLHKL